MSFPRRRESSIRVLPMAKTYYIYILASKRNGTLYVGVTSELQKRIYQHKNNLFEGFTERYGVHRLVHYEQTSDVQSAMEREKKIKNGMTSQGIGQMGLDPRLRGDDKEKTIQC